MVIAVASKNGHLRVEISVGGLPPGAWGDVCPALEYWGHAVGLVHAREGEVRA